MYNHTYILTKYITVLCVLSISFIMNINNVNNKGLKLLYNVSTLTLVLLFYLQQWTLTTTVTFSETLPQTYNIRRHTVRQ